MTFSPDGLVMFTASDQFDDIYQFNLSTAWDVSTAIYVNELLISGQETSVDGICFNSDGTRLYMVGSSSNSIHQYDLTTAYDITTMLYSGNSFNISAETTSPSDIALADDSTLLVLGFTSSSQIWQYNLGTANDITTASYSGVSTNINQQGTSNLGLFVTNNKIYVANNSNDRIDEYDAVLPAFSTDITARISDGTNNIDITNADFDTEVDCSSLTSRTLTLTWDFATTNTAKTPTLNNYGVYFT
jgi:sugar lactone lactonase YvrE